MAVKTATVTARIQPEVKREAEAVLERLGMPVSVLIDTLYRQIILTGGIPYPLTLPSLPVRGAMSDGELDSVLDIGYRQALAEDSILIDDAIDTHSYKPAFDQNGIAILPADWADDAE